MISYRNRIYSLIKEVHNFFEYDTFEVSKIFLLVQNNYNKLLGNNYEVLVIINTKNYTVKNVQK